ncbi:PRC-barrel domain-containing protein [Geminicoccus roseus]|uniref:PRC-barrel domain-containing protein n=1 Tax=Geminicoccus roseus TaxID=404900 RepID=UPI0003F96BA0|nr:PRC-barrel domain-containing protein [Geminicoccus roseus]
MKMYLMGVSAAALLTAVSVGAAHAQSEDVQDQAATTDQTEQQAVDQSAAAEQCRNDLQAMRQKMEEDGYWLSGWRGAGYGTAMMPGAPVAAANNDPAEVDQMAGQDAGVASPVAVGPWGAVGWQTRPHMELRTLYRAASVLAARGKQEACQSVVTAAEAIYQDYSSQLQELGVDPNEVSVWRQEQIANAMPVAQLGSSVRIDDVIGSDIRNHEDDSLGEVDDVVVDPQSGQIRYAVVAEGGFLGIGQDHVIVPWNQLRATPGFETLILPVSQDQLDQAPDYDRMAGEQVDLQSVDQYWSQALGEQAIGEQAQ